MVQPLTDLKLVRIEYLTTRVMAENERQLFKWGVQTRTPAEWHLFLSEEVGELAEAIAEHQFRQGSKNHVVSEAIQVATLALKIAEMYEEVEGA
jgi:NTP pyrophosphatase (non-canonical NTP hydrolase)|tara:strand:- start:240 stop:521 length:282 start_codon:yes stop_codon:yes gene_type:complete